MSASAKPGASMPVVAKRYIAADKMPFSAELTAIAASRIATSKAIPSAAFADATTIATTASGIEQAAIANDNTACAVS